MSKKVLLTGISGFIAKHVAIELLNSGYEVLGTVRNSSSIDQTKKTLEENSVSTEKLSFVKLDLLKDEGWNEAAEGCKYIIHVASPFPLKVSNDRESLTPAANQPHLALLIVSSNTVALTALAVLRPISQGSHPYQKKKGLSAKTPITQTQAKRSSVRPKKRRKKGHKALPRHAVKIKRTASKKLRPDTRHARKKSKIFFTKKEILPKVFAPTKKSL